MRFVYALRGRKGSKGLVKQYCGHWLNRQVFVIPPAHDYDILEVMKAFNVNYKRIPLLWG